MSNIQYKPGDKVVVNRRQVILKRHFRVELGVCLVTDNVYNGKVKIKSTLAKREGYTEINLILGHINVSFHSKSI